MRKRRFIQTAREERQGVFFRLPKSIDDEIERIARARRESLNTIAIELISAGLEHYASNEKR